MPQVHICQFIRLKMRGVPPLYAQNYFIGEDYKYLGEKYRFVPFQISGTSMALGGDNPVVSVMLPNNNMILQMLEAGDGNRNSKLEMYQVWLTPKGNPLPNPVKEFYLGIGAADDDVAVELRFRSAMDSVGSSFPRRVLTSENVGILPLSSEIYLR